MNLFHHAIRSNDLELFYKLLEPYQTNEPHREDINELENNTQLTPLQLAIYLGRFSMALQLLLFGANPNHRQDDTYHVLEESEIRKCSKVMRNLVFMAPDLDPRIRERFDARNIDTEVFHVFLFKALILNRNECALRLLTVTLPQFPENLKNEVIKNLTGALYYAALHNKQEIATRLKNLKVPLISSSLPNLGVKLISWLSEGEEETKEELQTFATAQQTKNYLALDKLMKLPDQLASFESLQAGYLPWLLLKCQNIYDEVNKLIKEKKWEQLQLIENAGYSIPSHIYQIIIGNRKNEIDCIKNLENYLSVSDSLYFILKQQFLLAVSDTLIINERILTILLRKEDIFLNDEEKAELTLKNKLEKLQRELQSLRPCEVAIYQFNLIIKEKLRPFNTSTSALQRQSTAILFEVTAFLTQKEIYSSLVLTAKLFATLAANDNLAYFPTPWMRYNNLPKRLQDINELIAELNQYRKITIKRFCHGDAPCAPLCCSSMPIAAVVGADIPLLCCSYVCSEAPGLSLSVFGGVNFSGVGLSILCCLGFVTKYYCCDSNLPGRGLAELTVEQKQTFQRGISLLPSTVERPTNTKDLIVALQTEQTRISSYDFKAKMETKLKNVPDKSSVKKEDKEGDLPEKSIWDDELKGGFFTAKDLAENDDSVETALLPKAKQYS